MVRVRIVEREAFRVVGRKTWIGGQDNEQFGRFWAQCREDGLLRLLGELTGGRPGAQTNGMVIGLSRVEADPEVREFFFHVCAEYDGPLPAGLEECAVPAGRWAVFANAGPLPEALVQAEMFCFTQWLPKSGYRHAPTPEMEVYPPDEDGALCEFWLPILLG